MATFLTNSKMAPALAERIESSVSGRRKNRDRSKRSPRLVVQVRMATSLTLLFLLGLVLFYRHRANTEFESQRSRVLATVAAQRTLLVDSDKDAVMRDEMLLVQLTGPYQGDTVAAEMRQIGAWDTVLSRTVVYVRGPIDAFAKSATIAPAAHASLKDALLYCLYDAPSSKAEKFVLPKVRIAYSTGRAIEQRTPHVRRLDEAEMGLPILLPPWSARVATAKDETEMSVFRVELEKANLTLAREALHAAILVAVLDEPGFGPSEIDGERPHDVRFAIVDIDSGKSLFRARKHVDPSAWSAAARAEYATGLDGCALAVDVKSDAARAL